MWRDLHRGIIEEASCQLSEHLMFFSEILSS